MKRFLAITLCLCMVLGFSGCSMGGNGGLMTSLVNFSAIESGTVESKVELSMDKKELEEAIMKIACMSEEGSLDDYKEYKEENEEYLEEMLEEYEDFLTTISVNYSGKQDKDMNTTGTLSYTFGKEKGDVEVAFVDKTAYIGIESFVDIVYMILELSEEELAEEIAKDDILEALEDYKYLELEAEDLDIDIEDIEDTLDMSTEDLQKLSKPVDNLLNTYFDSFIAKGKSGYTLTIKLNTLEENSRKVCEKIDKNPGKFFDALVEIVKVGQDIDLIESEEMDSIEDILGSLEDLKEARKEFVENWEDSDWEDELDEVFGTDYKEITELLGDTNLVLTASGNKKVASLSVTLNICIDSSTPCASLKVDTTMKSGKVEINAKDYSGKDTISTSDIEEVLEEELSKVLAHKYIDEYDFGSEDDEDYDFDEDDYDYEDEDEDETYVIDTPVGSSNKNFTSMLKEGPSVNGTTAAAYYNHYKSDFLNLTYSVLPELISEEPSESIENSYGSIAIYGNEEIDGVYNDASTYMYFSDGYLVAEFETSLMGKNSEKEVNAFVNHTNSLYGYKIDNDTIEDIIDNIEDDVIKEDSVHYEFEKNGINYEIMYYEFEGYNGKPVFTLGIEANYNF